MTDFTVFEYRFDNPELQEEFEKFFKINAIQPLFTNEHRSTPIYVSYVEAINIVKRGTYAKKIEKLHDILHFATGNKKYEQAIFKMIYESRSIQKLANISERAKELYNELLKTASEKKQENFWNIVFYTKEVY